MCTPSASGGGALAAARGLGLLSRGLRDLRLLVAGFVLCVLCVVDTAWCELAADNFECSALGIVEHVPNVKEKPGFAAGRRVARTYLA